MTKITPVPFLMMIMKLVGCEKFSMLTKVQKVHTCGRFSARSINQFCMQKLCHFPSGHEVDCPLSFREMSPGGAYSTNVSGLISRNEFLRMARRVSIGRTTNDDELAGLNVHSLAAKHALHARFPNCRNG